MDRLKIGIIFGGRSEEHPISVKSAQEVAKNLDTEKYEPFWIGITKSGAWKLCDGPDANWEHGSCRPAVLSPDRSAHGLLVLEHGQYETISLDLVLPVLHGKLGEDGAMQGLLELSGIPYGSHVKARGQEADPRTSEEQAAGKAAARERREAYVRGHQLAEMRAAVGLTQTELADALGVSQARVSKIEHGEISGIDVVRAYVAALGGSVDVVARLGDRSWRVA